MIYELRTSRALTAYSSRLRVRADSLMLSDDIGYAVAVQNGRHVVVYRLRNVRTVDPYLKYITDEFPADDSNLSDTDYCYNDDEALGQQV